MVIVKKKGKTGGAVYTDPKFKKKKNKQTTTPTNIKKQGSPTKRGGPTYKIRKSGQVSSKTGK